MVRTHAFTAKGLRLIPGQGTKIPQTARLAKKINRIRLLFIQGNIISHMSDQDDHS